MKKKPTNSYKNKNIINKGVVIASIMSVCSFILVAKIAVNIDVLQPIDTHISLLIYQLRNPFLTQIMIFFSLLGNEILFLLLCVIVFLLIWKKYYRNAFLILITIFAGSIINLVIKETILRDRPNLSPLFHELFHSFPSFHAMNAFIFYSLIFLLAYKMSRNKAYILLIFCTSSVIIFLVGLSRLYLGVHYLSDVIGGYLAGLGLVSGVYVIDKILRNAGKKKK